MLSLYKNVNRRVPGDSDCAAKRWLLPFFAVYSAKKCLPTHLLLDEFTEANEPEMKRRGHPGNLAGESAIVTYAGRSHPKHSRLALMVIAIRATSDCAMAGIMKENFWRLANQRLGHRKFARKAIRRAKRIYSGGLRA